MGTFFSKINLSFSKSILTLNIGYGTQGLRLNTKKSPRARLRRKTCFNNKIISKNTNTN